MRQGKIITPDVAEKIEHLCATMEKPTPSKIANKLGLKYGTVHWHMLCRGLARVKPPDYSQKPYVRNGLTINPYTREHDELLNSMRVDNRTFQEIAEALTAKFDISRNAHSVHNRAVMLAAVDDESEAA